MIKCPSCGEMLEDHAKFCISCGAQIKAEPSIPSERVRPEDEKDDGRVFAKKPYYNHRADFVGESKKERSTFLNYSERRMAYDKQEEVVHANPKYTPNAMMRTLSSKLRSGCVLLTIAGIFQAIYGMAAIFAAAMLAIIVRNGVGEDSMVAVIAAAVGIAAFGSIAMIGAITNLTTAGKNFRASKKAMINPKGLSEAFSTGGKGVGLIVLNALCAGIIGIIGAVLTNSARSYAQANMREIKNIEAKYN